MDRARIARKLDRPIVLAGLMGAGKTTVGRRLAERLGWPFRDGERKVIARLMEDESRAVIALGGGAFINEETRALIAEKAVSVWLHADIDILMERVGKRDTRPLLQTDDPRAVMEKLIEERTPIYAQADIHIHSHGDPHETSVAAIIEALADRVEAGR